MGVRREPAWSTPPLRIERRQHGAPEAADRVASFIGIGVARHRRRLRERRLRRILTRAATSSILVRCRVAGAGTDDAAVATAIDYDGSAFRELGGLAPAFGGAPLGNLYAPIGGRRGRAARSGTRSDAASAISIPRRITATASPSTGSAPRCAACPANDYLLSTKVGRLLVPDPRAPRDQHGYRRRRSPSSQRWDYSRDGTLRSIDDSLQRLGLARIDFVFIHDVARDAHGDAQPQRFREAMDGAVPALAGSRRRARSRGFGLGVNDWHVCVDALAHADLDVLLLAGRYTLLDQTALPELLPLCEARGTRIVRRRSVQFRHSRDRHASGRRPHAVLQLRAGAAARSSRGRRRSRTSAPRTACRSRPRRCSFRARTRQSRRVVAGARSIAELDENLALAERPIPAAFWRDLRARRLVAADAPLPGDAAR